MSEEHSTQFAGFAGLVVDRLKEEGLIALEYAQIAPWDTDAAEENPERAKAIIAECVYDLLVGIADQASDYIADGFPSKEAWVNSIPDIAEWPTKD